MMPKSGKSKVSIARSTQPTMGGFFSKQTKNSSTNNGSGSKTDRKAASKVTANLPSERRNKKRMWGNWAAKDTEEYRNGYPGKKDYLEKKDNMLFYMNQTESKPDGGKIEDIHANWYGDYGKLERHHGYIQWLFPIRETGLNWHSQELQLHEIKAIVSDVEAKRRILTSYKMMLDFYGMRLKDEETGEIERADNWRGRFQHLNRSFHNYLRITRILKCLGEFEYEYLKPGFVKYIMEEGLVHGTLDNLMESCEKYWVGVIRDEAARDDVWDYYDNLYSQQHNLELKDDKKKAKELVPNLQKQQEKRKDLKQDENTQNGESDKDTLEYAMSMINPEDGDADEEKTDKQMKDKLERKAHTMSDSEEEESQEASYLQENNNRNDNNEVGYNDDQMEEEKDDKVMERTSDLTACSDEVTDENKSKVGYDGNEEVIKGPDAVCVDEEIRKSNQEVSTERSLQESDNSKDEPNNDTDMVLETNENTIIKPVHSCNETEHIKTDGTEVVDDTENIKSDTIDKNAVDETEDNGVDIQENANENSIEDAKARSGVDDKETTVETDTGKVSNEKEDMEVDGDEKVDI